MKREESCLRFLCGQSCYYLKIVYMCGVLTSFRRALCHLCQGQRLPFASGLNNILIRGTTSSLDLASSCLLWTKSISTLVYVRAHVHCHTARAVA